MMMHDDNDVVVNDDGGCNIIVTMKMRLML